MPDKRKAISIGLGPIGASIARLALERKDSIDLIGAIDINPDYEGRDLGAVVGLHEKTGITVERNGDDLLSSADVVLHATSSFLGNTKKELLDLCKKNVDVVSTTEELSYPWYSHAQDANELDRAAKSGGVTLLGVGVNPGFVLDTLVITLSSVCSKVREIRGERILDATKRRIPFQKKVGIGLTREEFEDKVRSGTFGHIGLPESIALVVSSLGANIDRIEQKVEPRIASKEVYTEHFGLVKPGRVLGLEQDGRGYVGGRVVVDYHIGMYAAAEDPHDTISIKGDPNIQMTIPGGTPGDIATAAIVVNSVERVVEARPGLLTVKDLRPATSVLQL